MRIRKNVWKLPAGDETLSWYEKAVAAMKAKPIADPTSWRYQAAIHEYNRSSDPLRQSSDVLPSTIEQRQFWTQCQHGSWFFLSWHRMYLFHFEQIVADNVAKLGGPADWSLPYWNYSEGPAFRALPPAFRDPNLAGGNPNALYVKERAATANAGSALGDDSDVSLDCLTAPDFENLPGGVPGFGGPRTLFHHNAGIAGAVEDVPHGTMHVRVGGLGTHPGWMSSFNTAALDPIFWLHHANIDRLWEVWIRRDPSHQNSTSKQWLKGVTFQFHDQNGNVVSMKSEDVRTINAAPLSYTYEELADPLAVAPQALATVQPQPSARAMPEQPIPELIGASRTEFDLEPTTTHALVEVRPPTGPARLSALAAPARKQKWVLNIENVTSDGHAPSYDVYVNAPDASNPQAHPEHRVGRMAMFGLTESSRPGLDHPGSGLHYGFDITKLIDRLKAAPAWDPAKLRISFVPVGGETEATGARIKIGRVSIYAQ